VAALPRRRGPSEERSAGSDSCLREHRTGANGNSLAALPRRRGPSEERSAGSDSCLREHRTGANGNSLAALPRRRGPSEERSAGSDSCRREHRTGANWNGPARSTVARLPAHTAPAASALGDGAHAQVRCERSGVLRAACRVGGVRGVHGLVRCGAVLAQGAALIAILGVESSTGVAADCPASDDVAILASPRAPVAGRELRVFAASAAPIDGQLVVRAPDGSVAASASHAPGAAPSAFEKQRWRAEVAAPVAGMYRAEVVRGRDVVACSAIRVNGSEMPRRARPGGVVWPVEREWSPAEEALYAAWVEHLFDDPLDAEPSWHGIGDVLQDPDRNFLYDHLGLDEDADRRLRFQPDCADLPFFLRAYFAWKLGLPFGYSECSRGGPSSPPRCAGWHW